jgi:regulator of nucleoside diphosphate kinase
MRQSSLLGASSPAAPGLSAGRDARQLPFVWLCPEITRAHALRLMDWLADDRVTRHLSDSPHVSRFIARTVERTGLPVLTPLFNQGGRFFMVCDRHDVPAGFVRLVKTGPACEIVLVIGDRAHWGHGLGASALRASMKLAFFDMRVDSIVANIHPGNARSLGLFQRCGFQLERRTPTLDSYVLPGRRYLRLLREDCSPAEGAIHITELDEDRLRYLVAFEPASSVYELEHEIQRARVVRPQEVPRDVVTMHSRTLLRLDDTDVEVALVYPEHADESAGRLSVRSSIGTAILGYREGDAIDWRIQERTCRIQIAKVLYQPEAAGVFDL